MTFFKNKIVVGLASFFVVLGLMATVVFFILPLPGQIPVLMYHFIGTSEDAAQSGNFVTLETFEKQMNFLKMLQYRVISLDDFYAIKRGLRKPHGREVVITFDDGNPTAFKLALPVLKKHGFPSTHFLISSGLETGSYGSIAFEEIQDLIHEPLIIWGAHSRTHPVLSELSDADLESEIRGSKQELESRFQIPFHYFAYPFGDFDERALRLIEKNNFYLAFTTSPKKLKNIQRNKYCLTRVKISENSKNLALFWLKLSGLYEAYKLWRHDQIYPSKTFIKIS